MSILADWEIKALCSTTDTIMPNPRTGAINPIVIKGALVPMIEPFDEGGKRSGVISYGLSSYGYDIRLRPKYKVFTNVHGGVIDPKNAEPKHLFDMEGDVCEIPPNAYILGESVERFHMPNDVTGICLGKSTYSRVGVLVNVTPLEAGWKGSLVIEVANLSPLPVRVYANEGIAQIVFLRGQLCRRPYGVRSGTYQSQEGITLARVAT